VTAAAVLAGPWLATPAPTNLDQLPKIAFPVLGNKWSLGVLFLAHILFGSFSMGAVLLSPAFELAGWVRGDPRMERYAAGVANTNLKVFSLGATLGSFAVFVLTGLYPNLFVSAGVLFFKTLLVAFTIWFLILALLLLYAYRWEAMVARIGRPAHLLLGTAGGISEQLFLFLIVGLDSFMLTPNTGRDFAAIFNGSFWEELFHRFSGNLSWSSLLIAAVMVAWWAMHRDPEDRAYYAWAARVSLLVGFLLLIPQAAGGFLFAEAIRHYSPGAFSYSFGGPFAWLWQMQEAFFGVMLLGGNVYFWQSRDGPGPLSPLLTGAVLLLAVAVVLPSAAYPGQWFWLRYVAMALALLATLGHWLAWRPLHGTRRPEPGSLGRWAIALTGILAVVIFLLMGVIRETARDPFAIYGRMTQSQAEDLFRPPSGRFYP
jgi:cytochrome bd-type quinol oxidase subunit 1